MEIGQRLGPFDLIMLEVGLITRRGGHHAWDEPVETLFQQAPARGVPLVMPRLGQPVEPSRIEAVDPWWRNLAAGRLIKEPILL